MRRPDNLVTLSAFEQFATDCIRNARINHMTIEPITIMDMWRHLPTPEEQSPVGNPAGNEDNSTHSWSGRGQ